MKKVLLFIFFFLLILGVFFRNPVLTFQSADDKAVTVIQENLKKHVKFFTQGQPYRNYMNAEVLDQAGSYIEKHFKKYCNEVRKQTFKVKQVEYSNIICFFKGQGDERIVVGAHYDSEGEQPGADDNASGVAGILELARVIGESQHKLAKDVEIVAYTLEEPPYFRTPNMGSFHHARSLREQNVKVDFMISVEMIGYFSDEWFSQRYPSPLLYLFYPFKGNFITLVSRLKDYFSVRKLKKSIQRWTDLPVFSLSAPSFVTGVDYSDHLNYWHFGYRAFMLTDTSFYRNSNYHQKTDTMETLDFTRMAKVVSGLVGIIVDNTIFLGGV